MKSQHGADFPRHGEFTALFRRLRFLEGERAYAQQHLTIRALFICYSQNFGSDFRLVRVPAEHAQNTGKLYL